MSVGLMATLVALGCGGGSDTPRTPTQPTPPPVPAAPPNPAPPPTPTAFSLNGRVVSSATGQPIAGARVAPEVGDAVTTGADGVFQFSSPTNPPFTPYKVEIAADGYVTRNAYVRWERTRMGVDIDLLLATPPFSLDFFRQLVRNGFEKPNDLDIVRRLSASPSVYIKTRDDAGRDIDPLTLDMVQTSIRRSVSQFSGGVLTVAAMETGPTSRALTDGWIMVEFVDDPDGNFCGRARIGAAAGLITLNYNRCGGCGGLRLRPATVAHETGHALGFWHVRERHYLMSPVEDKPCTTDAPSAEEQFHARLAYKRATGNKDPDQDVQAGALALPVFTAAPETVTCFGR